MVIVSYDFDVVVKDPQGVEQQIVSQSTRSFRVPDGTKTDEIKALMSKGKITIIGEMKQFKSEMKLKIG